MSGIAKMTTTEFQNRHPKPWRFAMNGCSFSLRDAQDNPIGTLDLRNFHPGTKQSEWNRHIEMALREHIPCVTEIPKTAAELQQQIAP